MSYSLETIITDYFYKRVEIKLTTWSDFKFDGYLIGIKLPYAHMMMLYYIKTQHIEKFVKHENKRWIEMLPLELIDVIRISKDHNDDIEDLLHIMMIKKDITYEPEI